MPWKDDLYLSEEFPGQWIRVMCDFGCDGVWNRNGQPGDLEALPISNDLKQRIGSWQRWYDRCEDVDEHFDLPDEFSAEGLLIARALKSTLADWTVVYFDEARAARRDFDVTPRGDYEYEVLPGDCQIS